MFGENPVSRLGEKQLISRICGVFGSACPPAPFGSGDDCALIEAKTLSENVYITVDSVIANRHFTETDAPELVGQKLLKRNISDIASMGARPKKAVCAAVISPDLSIDWLDGFARGLADCAAEYGVDIVGGDIASPDVAHFFSMSLTLLGDSPLPPLRRGGAVAGDVLYTTGRLGFSFESGRHLTFEPRVEQGVWLAEWNASGRACKITSCTDISDGIASDISNVLPADMRAVLLSSSVPCSEFMGRVSLEKALCDGEDYELLFSLSASSERGVSEFETAYAARFGMPLFRIGKVCRQCASGSARLWIFDGKKEKPFSKNGFEHAHSNAD